MSLIEIDCFTDRELLSEVARTIQRIETQVQEIRNMTQQEQVAVQSLIDTTTAISNDVAAIGPAFQAEIANLNTQITTLTASQTIEDPAVLQSITDSVAKLSMIHTQLAGIVTAADAAVTTGTTVVPQPVTPVAPPTGLNTSAEPV